VTFRGWTYALEEYSKVLEEPRLVIEIVREPKPVSVADDRGSAFPVFLYLGALKPAGAPSRRVEAVEP
jgi:hypothetical protein